MTPRADSPLEAAARATYWLDCKRIGTESDGWEHEPEALRESYRCEARAALTAAVEALPEGGTVNGGSVPIPYDEQTVVWVNRAALLRALTREDGEHPMSDSLRALRELDGCRQPPDYHQRAVTGSGGVKQCDACLALVRDQVLEQAAKEAEAVTYPGNITALAIRALKGGVS